MAKLDPRNWMGMADLMPMGKLKCFTRVYGFVEPDDGSADVFVHVSEIERAGFSEVREGQRVSYETIGMIAANLRAV